jgi:hypothetical protein
METLFLMPIPNFSKYACSEYGDVYWFTHRSKGFSQDKISLIVGINQKSISLMLRGLLYSRKAP